MRLQKSYGKILDELRALSQQIEDEALPQIILAEHDAIREARAMSDETVTTES